VQNLVGDSNGLGIALPKAVYDALDRVQTRLCEEANAYETFGTMNLIANTERYNYPDGMVSEIAIVPGTFGTIVGSAVTKVGYVNGIMEVNVNTTDTLITFDDAFIKTYVDLGGNTVPAYRLTIESATISGSTVAEEITIVSKTLGAITLRSSSNNTKVKFRAEE
jgi:hypothetical protein